MDNETEPNCLLPDPILQLSERLRERKANGLRFCQKLYLALEESTLHPQFVNFIGVKWLDQSAFACNVEIFARIIHIKRNSINKQFSQFQFDKISSNQYAFLLNSLNNSRYWVARRCRNPLFHQTASLIEIGQIENKEVSQIPFGQPIEVSYKADPFLHTLPNINAVKAIFDETGKNIPDIELAIDEWNQIVMLCNNELTLDNVVTAIIRYSEVEVISYCGSFIKHLLQNNTYSSVAIKDVTFLDYYKLFLRFGRLPRIAYSISTLIDVEKKMFYQWFRPNCDTKVTTPNMLLLYVRLSTSSPSAFTLVTESYTKKIFCRPRAMSEEIFACDTFKSSSIPQLLVNMGIIEPKPLRGDKGWAFSEFSQSFSQNPESFMENPNPEETFEPF